MKPRIIVIAGLGLVVLIVSAAVALNFLPAQPALGVLATPSSSQTAAASSPQASPTGPPGPATSEPTTGATETSAAAKKPSASPGSAKNIPTVKPVPAVPAVPAVPPSTVNPKKPLEVPATQAPKNPGLPKSRVAAPLIKLPLPAAGNANGSLVKGFPSSIIPEMPSSAVKSSSVSPQGSILQVSLVAHSAAEPLAIMDYYQKQFAALGLGAAQAPSADGSTAMWFTRGDTKITVTASDHQSGGTNYIVFGVLHAGS